MRENLHGSVDTLAPSTVFPFFFPPFFSFSLFSSFFPVLLFSHFVPVFFSFFFVFVSLMSVSRLGEKWKDDGMTYGKWIIAAGWMCTFWKLFLGKRVTVKVEAGTCNSSVPGVRVIVILVIQIRRALIKNICHFIRTDYPFQGIEFPEFLRVSRE